MTDRGKEKDRALQKLTPVLIRRLSAQDVKHDLYGKGQLTWAELDRIGTYAGGGRDLMTYVCLSRCRGCYDQAES